MANWSNPTLTSTYTDFLGELKNRDDDLAKQFDGTTSSNLATGTIRWNSTANRWQKWNGSAWAELTGTYALTALTTTSNASIGGTLAVTGATTLAAATATTPATGDNSTAVATTAYVRAQGYAPLANPALTGTPTVPTAAVDTNTTQAASTAFVRSQVANDAPSKTGVGALGTWGINVSGNAATVSNGVYTNSGATITAQHSYQTNNTVIGDSAGGLTRLEVIGTGGAAFMQFHRPNAWAAYFGLDSDNQFKIGGWSFGAASYPILHTGNFNTYVPTLAGVGATGTWGITSNLSNNLTQFFNTNWNTDFAAAPPGSTILRGDTSTGSATGGPGGSWWFQQNMRHINSTNAWGVQVAWGWEDNANRLRTRNVSGGTYSAWVDYWNSANDGAGSGLDADLLDGLNTQASGSAIGANQIARSDGNGYSFFHYINSNTANSENPSIAQVIVTNGTDAFYRKASIAHLTSAVQSNAGGTWGISVTGNAATATNPASGGSFITSSNIGAQGVAFATSAGSTTGNAATVTNGVYTEGTQTINGAKTFTARTQIATTGDIFSGLASNTIGDTTERFLFSAATGIGSTLCSSSQNVLTLSRVSDTGTALRFGRAGSAIGRIQVSATDLSVQATGDLLLGGNNSTNLELLSTGVSRFTGLLRAGTNVTPTTATTKFITRSVATANNGDVGMESNCDGTGTRHHISFVNPNGVVGSITTSGSATAYVTSSDYRLKENITPLEGAIARLSQLPVHRFNFIADPDKEVDGFLAHEAAAVVPECVTGEKDEVDEDGEPVYQGIDQSKVVPLLTAALQEAIAMISALETRIAALEA